VTATSSVKCAVASGLAKRAYMHRQHGMAALIAGHPAVGYRLPPRPSSPWPDCCGVGSAATMPQSARRRADHSGEPRDVVGFGTSERRIDLLHDRRV